MATCRAAVITEHNKPLSIQQVTIPELDPGSLLIKITASTLCGTDVHRWHGPLGRGDSLPIITGLVSSSFQQIDEKLLLQIKALGTTKLQYLFILLKEKSISIIAAVMAGFGRVIAEVGAAMMVGGNILGETRILTTSIVMEVSKGNFDVAIALSFILMTLAFIITFCLTTLQQRRQIK